MKLLAHRMGFDLDAVDEEDSPYPEVRASVSNVDDPEMPALTFRMWAIGLVLCMIGSAMNVFFNFRQPAPTIVPSVLLLVAHPIGKFLAFTMPIRSYRTPRFFGLGPYEVSFNPGPWNIKEHARDTQLRHRPPEVGYGRHTNHSPFLPRLSRRFIQVHSC